MRSPRVDVNARLPVRIREGRGDHTLVLLHGRGADEHDLFGLFDVLDPERRLRSDHRRRAALPATGRAPLVRGAARRLPGPADLRRRLRGAAAHARRRPCTRSTRASSPRCSAGWRAWRPDRLRRRSRATRADRRPRGRVRRSANGPSSPRAGRPRAAPGPWARRRPARHRRAARPTRSSRPAAPG